MLLKTPPKLSLKKYLKRFKESVCNKMFALIIPKMSMDALIVMLVAWGITTALFVWSMYMVLYKKNNEL